MGGLSLMTLLSFISEILFPFFISSPLRALMTRPVDHIAAFTVQVSNLEGAPEPVGP
jgi:hypothetical protein